MQQLLKCFQTHLAIEKQTNFHSKCFDNELHYVPNLLVVINSIIVTALLTVVHKVNVHTAMQNDNEHVQCIVILTHN